jgi:hypothetical protein
MLDIIKEISKYYRELIVVKKKMVVWEEGEKWFSGII